MLSAASPASPINGATAALPVGPMRRRLFKSINPLFFVTRKNQTHLLIQPEMTLLIHATNYDSLTILPCQSSTNDSVTLSCQKCTIFLIDICVQDETSLWQCVCDTFTNKLSHR